MQQALFLTKPVPRAPAPAPPEVEVRRSPRRRKTVSAYRDGERIVVLLPARMSRADERHWVRVMTERLAARDRRQRPSDDALMRRALELGGQYLPGQPAPASVRWVDNQSARWGSCTVEDRAIRLSRRLHGMPSYVLDYVLLHELAHLSVPDHGPRFWAQLAAFPRTERARGFLEGCALATSSTPGQRDDVMGSDDATGFDDVTGFDDAPGSNSAPAFDSALPSDINPPSDSTLPAQSSVGWSRTGQDTARDNVGDAVPGSPDEDHGGG